LQVLRDVVGIVCGDGALQALPGAERSCFGTGKHQGFISGNRCAPVAAARQQQGQVGRIRHGAIRAFTAKRRHQMRRIADQGKARLLSPARDILFQGNREALAGFEQGEIDQLVSRLGRVIGNVAPGEGA